MSSNYMDYGGGDHQTADQGCIYGCLIAGKVCGRRILAYMLYARSLCDTKATLQLRYAACGAIHV